MERPARVAGPGAFPAIMGAFGVAMGFAAFVLVREQTQGVGASTKVFLLGLVAAVVTSFAIESVRERAEGHATGSAVDPGRVLGLLVLMSVFEVYVSGAEEVVKLVAAGAAAPFVNALFASGITANLGVLTQLILFAGLWVVLGAVAAWAMLRTDDAKSPAETRRSAMVALLGRIGLGLLLVGALTLAYVLVARIGLTIWVLLTRPQDYAPAFDTLLPDGQRVTGNAFTQLPVMMASALEALAHTGRWGGVALLGVASSLVVYSVWMVRTRTPGTSVGLLPRLVMLTLGLLALGPFATSGAQMGRLVRIVGATTLTWVAPLVVLAVATPLLRAPARSPRLWGIVSFAVAVVLVVVTWDRLSQPTASLLVLAVVLALVVTAWLFWRGADVVKFWPLVALTLAIAAFEGSSVLQRLTFLSTFKEAALLQTTPLTGGDETRARRGFRAVAAWARDSLIDASTASTVAAAGQLSSDASAAALDSLGRRVSAAVDQVYGDAIGALCQPSGVAVIDTLHREVANWCAGARAMSDATEDSVRVFWQALFNADEPWGDGLSSLLDGADEASREAVFDFRWAEPGSLPSQQMLARAAAALPFDPLEITPAALMARAMSDSGATASEKVWMVLASLSRDVPRRAAFDVWLSDRERDQLAADQASAGIAVPTVMSWWFRRTRHLANLVEAYHLAGIPAEPPASVIRISPRTVDRFERATYVVTALHFAREQLRGRQRGRDAGAALTADASVSMLLELSLGASFAFWATAGLLAGLARREQQLLDASVQTSSST
jgi:hypothetical protein